VGLSSGPIAILLAMPSIYQKLKPRKKGQAVGMATKEIGLITARQIAWPQDLQR